jgi:competence protein ComEA
MRRLTGLFVSCIVLTAVAAPAARAAKAVDGVVNLNTAEPGALGLLPGIGPAKAAQIVAYRRRHPFRTVDELVRIKGIGRKMVRRLRAHLAVAGPTTATGIVVAPGAVSPPAPPTSPRAPPVPARSPAPPARPSGLRSPLPGHPPLAQRSRRELRTTHGICPSPR